MSCREPRPSLHSQALCAQAVENACPVGPEPTCKISGGWAMRAVFPILCIRAEQGWAWDVRWTPLARAEWIVEREHSGCFEGVSDTLFSLVSSLPA